MKTSMNSLLIVSSCVFFLACKTSDRSGLKDASAHFVAGQSNSSLYNDQENWPGVCQTGNRQSPIALNTSYIANVARSSSLDTSFKPVTTKVVDDGHSIKAVVLGGVSSLKLDTAEFDLIQFHFHERSEHTLNGEMFDGELHFVHKERSGGRLVALGIFLQESKSGSESGLEKFFDSLPLNAEPQDGESHAGQSAGHGERELVQFLNVDPSTIIKSGNNYLIYNGSLTTPGCDETVIHMVATEALVLSSKSLAKLRSYYTKTNRKIQTPGADTVRDFRTARR